MPPQFSLVTALLNVTRPDFFSFTIAFLVLSTTSSVESTWDLTNRICDSYFSAKPANRKSSDKVTIG